MDIVDWIKLNKRLTETIFNALFYYTNFLILFIFSVGMLVYLGTILPYDLAYKLNFYFLLAIFLWIIKIFGGMFKKFKK